MECEPTHTPVTVAAIAVVGVIAYGLLAALAILFG